MAILIGRRRLLALALGLAVMFASPLQAVAEGLPAYDAKAGMLPIGADPERPDAEIFHVSYTLKDADPAKRPVTFVFNGGPGAASIYLHLSAIGPKTIVTAGDGSFPAVPARLEDNPDSWIGFTDLVFIDPVGTGYSRMLPGPDGALRDPTPYYKVEGDLDAIAIFMRQWLTVNKRWASPKAIAGESYGGQRVAALSRILAEKYAINLNRAILISPALNVELTQTNYAIVWPMTPDPHAGRDCRLPWAERHWHRSRGAQGGGGVCAHRICLGAGKARADGCQGPGGVLRQGRAASSASTPHSSRAIAAASTRACSPPTCSERRAR